jgi:signal transduction histidine kinase
MRESNKIQEAQTKTEPEESNTFQVLAVQPATPKREPALDSIKIALEAERLRIKHALHDDTIQRLTAIKLKFEFFLVAPHEAAVRLYGDMIRDDLERTINSLRYFIEDMEDEDIAERTLITLLREFEAKFLHFYFMRVFVYENNVENTFPLTTKEKTELLFILKEAVQNAIKYSASGQCHIHLTWQSDHLLMEIEDRGFVMSPSAKKGYGLTSMEARANAIGATLSVGIPGGKGVVVTAVLPKTKLAHSDVES